MDYFKPKYKLLFLMEFKNKTQGVCVMQTRGITTVYGKMWSLN